MTDAFADLDAFLALPRLSGLALSPDGSRLVTTVATLDPKSTRHVGALWEVDPTGARGARQLTRSRKGEGGATFTPDGTVLFSSARPDPEREDDDLGSMLLQGGGDAVSAADCGFAADARVGYLIIEPFFAQAAGEQARPVLPGRQSIAGGETVPVHQDRRCGRGSGPEGQRAGDDNTKRDAEQLRRNHHQGDRTRQAG